MIKDLNVNHTTSENLKKLITTNFNKIVNKFILQLIMLSVLPPVFAIYKCMTCL